MLPTSIPYDEPRPGLTKVIYGPPEGVPNSECGTLETLQGTYLGGVFDGSPAIVSYWKLNPEEIEAAKKGFPVELVLLQSVCPVIQLNVIVPE
ncbi:MAG TPA: hypothetical protein VGD26_02600 [Chitinophagaceae bacterium]